MATKKKLTKTDKSKKVKTKKAKPGKVRTLDEGGIDRPVTPPKNP